MIPLNPPYVPFGSILFDTTSELGPDMANMKPEVIDRIVRDSGAPPRIVRQAAAMYLCGINVLIAYLVKIDSHKIAGLLIAEINKLSAEERSFLKAFHQERPLAAQDQNSASSVYFKRPHRALRVMDGIVAKIPGLWFMGWIARTAVELERPLSALFAEHYKLMAPRQPGASGLVAISGDSTAPKETFSTKMGEDLLAGIIIEHRAGNLEKSWMPQEDSPGIAAVRRKYRRE